MNKNKGTLIKPKILEIKAILAPRVVSLPKALGTTIVFKPRGIAQINTNNVIISCLKPINLTTLNNTKGNKIHLTKVNK